jgi:hypothetical protein
MTANQVLPKRLWTLGSTPTTFLQNKSSNLFVAKIPTTKEPEDVTAKANDEIMHNDIGAVPGRIEYWRD